MINQATDEYSTEYQRMLQFSWRFDEDDLRVRLRSLISSYTENVKTFQNLRSISSGFDPRYSPELLSVEAGISAITDLLLLSTQREISIPYYIRNCPRFADVSCTVEFLPSSYGNGYRAKFVSCFRSNPEDGWRDSEYDQLRGIALDPVEELRSCGTQLKVKGDIWADDIPSILNQSIVMTAAHHAKWVYTVRRKLTAQGVKLVDSSDKAPSLSFSSVFARLRRLKRGFH